MNLKKFAHNEYKQYCLKEGSEYIASEFALLQILTLIKKYNIKNILEVGIGIGTLSGSILKFARKAQFPVNIVATEANEFCLSQIPKNLGSDNDALKCYNNLISLPINDHYDLIIIDGAEKNLEEIKGKLNLRGIIAIEGDRADQVEIIRTIFPRAKMAHLISMKRNGSYSVQNAEDYQGGLKLVFTAPDIFQLTHWFKLKMDSKIKYYRRKYS